MPYRDAPIDKYQVNFWSLDSMVRKESIARIIDCFVDNINLDNLGFDKAKPEFEGRPAYDPRCLLKLYLYGYRNGIRSSRKLAEACITNIEVMWMLEGLTPDFRTISDFRKINVERLKSVFKEFTDRVTANLEVGFFSVDGSKFKAWNSKDRNFTANKLDDRIQWLNEDDEQIKRYIKDLENEDAAENSTGTLNKEELEEKRKDVKERLTKYHSYREIMEREKLSQISLTDPDARLMKDKDGMSVAYNIQTAVETKNHLILNYEVTNCATDHGQIMPTMQALRDERKDNVLEAVADRGYEQNEDIITCLENGIIPHVIPPKGKDSYELEIEFNEASNLDASSTLPDELSRCIHAGVIPKVYEEYIEKIEVREVRRKVVDDNCEVIIPGSEEEMRARAAEGYFVRDPERDLVYCPGDEILRPKCIKKNGATRYSNKFACSHCQYKGLCFSGKGITKWKEIDFSKDCLEKKARWMKPSATEELERQEFSENPSKIEASDNFNNTNIPENIEEGSTEVIQTEQDKVQEENNSRKIVESNDQNEPEESVETDSQGSAHDKEEDKQTKKKGLWHYEKKKIVKINFKPDKEKMDKRKCTSEHPFGTIKRALGSSFLLLKGLKKVNGETALFATSYNIARAQNLFSFSNLMKVVKG